MGSIITGESKDKVRNFNLQDLDDLVSAFVDVCNSDDIDHEKHIELAGKTLRLPNVSKHLGALFNDQTVQRYALTEAISTSTQDLAKADLDKVTSLLAALYIRPGEMFTDELFLKRKKDFENASLNTVKSAFFLQQKLLTASAKRIRYFSMASRKWERLRKKFKKDREK